LWNCDNHTRRSILRTLALGPLAGSIERLQAAAPESRPNVLLIYSDDQGTLDAGCYGSTDLHTPNIDALARRGVRFTQAYAHTVCCPSRATLLTGRYPQRGGVNDWTSNHASDENHRSMYLSEVTIAEVLRQAGYRTALFGKWHLGAKLGYRPLDQGFDEFFGHLGGFIDYYEHKFLHSQRQQPPFHDLYRGNREVFENGVYFPDLVVREANRFLSENRRRPFFLYLAFNLPHYPEKPDPRFAALYEGMPMPRRAYAAMVSTLDDRVGRVLAKLDELNLRRNTLVLFMSDNGHSTEDYKNWGESYGANGGGGNTGNWRGAKNSFLEGGIRVPCIMSFPGWIPTGEVRDQAIQAMDFFPTILEACRVPQPDRTIDGSTLWPVLRTASAPPPHKVMYWQWQKQWLVREGVWKLIGNGIDTTAAGSPHFTGRRMMDPVFLANLDDDPPESINHAAEKPELVAHLTRLHDEWLKEVTPPHQQPAEAK